MKQCPECNETFDDQKAFCDMDGSLLVDQTDSLRAALSQANASSTSSGNASMWMTGAIGGLIGVIVCVLLYLLFLVPGRQNAVEQDRHSNEPKETRPVAPSQVALVPANNQVHPSESPSPGENESPAASPSPAAPAATPPPAALNNGPIATGTKAVAANGEIARIVATHQWDADFTRLYTASRDYLFSLRNGLTAYAVLSPEPNSSGLRRCRLDGACDPVGSNAPPAV